MKNRKKWLLAGLLAVLTLALTTTALAHGGHHGRHSQSRTACPAETCVFIDENGDGICDRFAPHRLCVDADGDGVCDRRCKGYADADSDGLCDNCERPHAKEGCAHAHRGHGCRRG